MQETAPKPPRRLFLASLLAAIGAGGATYLASVGWVSAPNTEVFQFARGTALANGEDARLRGFLSRAAEDDRVTVIIIGHSGTQGDADANLALSQERADVVRGLAEDLGIPGARITAGGVGGGAPLSKPSDLSDRAYEASLARAQVTLQVRR